MALNPSSSTGQSSCLTTFPVKQIATCTLVVDSFPNLNRSIWSNLFSPSYCSSSYTANGNQFRVYLYPKSYLTDYEDCVLISLWYNFFKNSLTVRYRISIIDANGEKRHTKALRWHYDNADNNNLVGYINRNFLLDREHRRLLLPNEKLTIYCEVEIVGDEHSNLNPEIPSSSFPTLDKYDISKDFQQLLVSGNLHDVVLKIGDKQFQAHKTILAARSPVFSAMFQHSNTKEAQENRIDIIDITPEAGEILLRYIYTGSCGASASWNDHVSDLFIAADKYQLKHLKNVCAKVLSTALSVSTVIEIFLLADMHQATQLKAKCVDYITENSAQVMAGEGWKLLNGKPDLLMELYRDLSKSHSILKTKD